MSLISLDGTLPWYGNRIRPLALHSTALRSIIININDPIALLHTLAANKSQRHN